MFAMFLIFDIQNTAWLSVVPKMGTNSNFVRVANNLVYDAISVYKPSVSAPFCLSYHEATGDIWLEDFVKGAFGEGAAVEGENLRHVAHTVFIMSASLYCQKGLGVVGAGFVL